MKIFFLALLIMPLPLLSQNTGEQEISGEGKGRIIKKINDLMISTYIFPDVARQCAEALLKQNDAGKFESVSGLKAFASELTKSLQEVSMDKHIEVVFTGNKTSDHEIKESGLKELIMSERELYGLFRSRNYAIYRLERIKNNIGYVDIRGFYPYEYAVHTLANIMSILSNFDAIIIDLRNSLGGDPETVLLLESYFLRKGTHISSIWWKGDNTITEYRILDSVPGERLPDVPVFILCGTKTRSAAGSFSYDMQSQGRAEIIGCRTVGAANPGDYFKVNEDYKIFIPYGKVINEVTKTNWEGKGIKPDIELDEEEAYFIALDNAKQAAENYRLKKEAKLDKCVDKLVFDLNKCAKNQDVADGISIRGLIYSILDRFNACSDINEHLIIDLAEYYIV